MADSQDMTDPRIRQVEATGYLHPEPEPWCGTVYVEAVFAIEIWEDDECHDEDVARDKAKREVESAVSLAVQNCPTGHVRGVLSNCIQVEADDAEPLQAEP